MEKILSREILGPIIIIGLYIVIYAILSNLIKKIAKIKLNTLEAKRTATIISLINNVIKYAMLFISIIMILNIYHVDTSALIASLGAISVVAGLAFQDILKDFLSGFFIIVEKQYNIGDTVTIDEFKGEVISVGLKTTRIRAFTGEIKIISNRNITSVINHSLEKSLAIVDFQVAYESDLNEVEQVLTNLCKRLTNELEDLNGEVNLVGIMELASSGITYRITANTLPMKQYNIEREILKQIKLELDANNISIPYNQLVIHNA